MEFKINGIESEIGADWQGNIVEGSEIPKRRHFKCILCLICWLE